MSDVPVGLLPLGSEVEVVRLNKRGVHRHLSVHCRQMFPAVKTANNISNQILETDKCFISQNQKKKKKEMSVCLLELNLAYSPVAEFLLHQEMAQYPTNQ